MHRSLTGIPSLDPNAFQLPSLAAARLNTALTCCALHYFEGGEWRGPGCSRNPSSWCDNPNSTPRGWLLIFKTEKDICNTNVNDKQSRPLSLPKNTMIIGKKERDREANGCQETFCAKARMHTRTSGLLASL